MKSKYRFILSFLVLVIGTLLASPWFMVGTEDRLGRRSKLVDELNQGVAGKSWRVESVLGRDAAHLFLQGQRCYLSRTLGPR